MLIMHVTYRIAMQEYIFTSPVCLELWKVTRDHRKQLNILQ